MKFELFKRVALKQSIPEHRLCAGDLATIVEYHEAPPHQEPGYTLEVFNAVGETIAVVTVRESQLEPLSSSGMLQMRNLEPATK